MREGVRGSLERRQSLLLARQRLQLSGRLGRGAAAARDVRAPSPGKTVFTALETGLANSTGSREREGGGRCFDQVAEFVWHGPGWRAELFICVEILAYLHIS